MVLEEQLAHYLETKDYEEFRVCDITQGYQIGELSDKVLCEFSRKEKIFNGKPGRFRIKPTYGPMSVRSFEA